jgi:hypothetical protein
LIPWGRARCDRFVAIWTNDAMLYSSQANIAFVHYPKTAGCSIVRWFVQTFPDAEYVAPENPHLPVRLGLQRLGLAAPEPAVESPRPAKQRGFLRRIAGLRLADVTPPALPPPQPRIIGVIREPFEMLVSLFEYWRRWVFQEEPKDPLIRLARTGTFREFLVLGVAARTLANYETFFDLGGPAWSATRLLDFSSLEPALAEACREFRIQATVRLGRDNAAPAGRRDLDHYRDEAGELMADVHDHFRWYYEHGIHAMIRGPAMAALNRRLAA